jgi:FkbM family methyltransferase
MFIRLFKYYFRYYYLNITINCNSIWLGSKYGGFYIFPNSLSENSIIYSFGIGDDISFDISLIKKFNCKIFAFDPTPKSIYYINDNFISLSNFHFFDYGLSNISGLQNFYLPKNNNFISGSTINQNNVNINNFILVKMKTFKEINEIFDHKIIDILKMDIEGSEYDVIDDILNSNVIINQILVEFHDRFIFNGNSKTKKFINKLNNYGFHIFAISNSFQEVSFIRKEFLINQELF